MSDKIQELQDGVSVMLGIERFLRSLPSIIGPAYMGYRVVVVSWFQGGEIFDLIYDPIFYVLLVVCVICGLLSEVALPAARASSQKELAELTRQQRKAWPPRPTEHTETATGPPPITAEALPTQQEELQELIKDPEANQ